MFISEYDGLQGLGAVDSVYVQKIAWSCAQLFAIFHMEYLLRAYVVTSKDWSLLTAHYQVAKLPGRQPLGRGVHAVRETRTSGQSRKVDSASNQIILSPSIFGWR